MRSQKRLQPKTMAKSATQRNFQMQTQTPAQRPSQTPGSVAPTVAKEGGGKALDAPPQKGTTPGDRPPYSPMPGNGWEATGMASLPSTNSSLPAGQPDIWQNPLSDGGAGVMPGPVGDPTAGWLDGPTWQQANGGVQQGMGYGLLPPGASQTPGSVAGQIGQLGDLRGGMATGLASIPRGLPGAQGKGATAKNAALRGAAPSNNRAAVEYGMEDSQPMPRSTGLGGIPGGNSTQPAPVTPAAPVPAPGLPGVTGDPAPTGLAGLARFKQMKRDMGPGQFATLRRNLGNNFGSWKQNMIGTVPRP